MLYLQTIYLTFYQYDCWIRLNFLFLSLLYIYYIKFFLKSQLRNFQGSGLSSTFSGLILRASGHKSLIKQALFILIWSWLPSDKFAVWALSILIFFSFFFRGRTLLSASRIPVFIILSLSAIGQFACSVVVDPVGLEPTTSCVQSMCSPRWAKGP